MLTYFNIYVRTKGEYAHIKTNRIIKFFNQEY